MKRTHLLPLFILFTTQLIAQEKKETLNLPKYNNEWIHFGFSLMLNQNMTIIDQNKNVTPNYQFYPKSPNGFGIGITSELNIHKNIAFRFTPDISFLSRDLNYRSSTPANSTLQNQETESTVINLPLDLKLRTNRMKNWDAYILSGIKYQMDLQQKTNASTVGYIQYRDRDLSFGNGVGADLFLQYFKVSLDCKYYLGLTDLAIHNNSVSNSINTLRSGCIVLSLCFEG